MKPHNATLSKRTNWGGVPQHLRAVKPSSVERQMREDVAGIIISAKCSVKSRN
jgi:hypothetical protein